MLNLSCFPEALFCPSHKESGRARAGCQGLEDFGCSRETLLPPVPVAQGKTWL